MPIPINTDKAQSNHSTSRSFVFFEQLSTCKNDTMTPLTKLTARNRQLRYCQQLSRNSFRLSKADRFQSTTFQGGGTSLSDYPCSLTQKGPFLPVETRIVPNSFDDCCMQDFFDAAEITGKTSMTEREELS